MQLITLGLVLQQLVLTPNLLVTTQQLQGKDLMPQEKDQLQLETGLWPRDPFQQR